MRRLSVFLGLWLVRAGAFSPRNTQLTLHAWCSSAFCPRDRQGKGLAVGRQPHSLVARTVSVDISGGASDTVTVSSVWGVAGVLAMLINAIKRVLPVALEPFQSTSPGLSPPLWAAYGIFALGMGYVEGYKAFHKKFSPLVVSRSMTLSSQSPVFHNLLAPLYAMGLFHATPKRCKTSWGFIIGIFGLVKLVKQLSYPWRSIVDGGVVVGLSVGIVSIVYHFIRELRGVPAPANPSLP